MTNDTFMQQVTEEEQRIFEGIDKFMKKQEAKKFVEELKLAEQSAELLIKNGFTEAGLAYHRDLPDNIEWLCSGIVDYYTIEFDDDYDAHSTTYQEAKAAGRLCEVFESVPVGSYVELKGGSEFRMTFYALPDAKSQISAIIKHDPNNREDYDARELAAEEVLEDSDWY